MHYVKINFQDKFSKTLHIVFIMESALFFHQWLQNGICCNYHLQIHFFCSLTSFNRILRFSLQEKQTQQNWVMLVIWKGTSMTNENIDMWYVIWIKCIHVHVPVLFAVGYCQRINRLWTLCWINWAHMRNNSYQYLISTWKNK